MPAAGASGRRGHLPVKVAAREAPVGHVRLAPVHTAANVGVESPEHGARAETQCVWRTTRDVLGGNHFAAVQEIISADFSAYLMFEWECRVRVKSISILPPPGDVKEASNEGLKLYERSLHM